MKIEAGKFYRSKDGRKIGPMSADKGDVFRGPGAGIVADGHRTTVPQRYNADGTVYWSRRGEEDDELVAEWTDELGLVRSVTRKEIVVGRHGHLYVGQRDNDFLPIRIELNGAFTAAELRNEIVKLTEIANAMDEIAK